MVLPKGSPSARRGCSESCIDAKVLADVHFGSTLSALEVPSMERCNPFKEFSSVLSPELESLSATARKKRSILIGLYRLAQGGVENEQKRQWIREQLRQLGPRLRKYGQLAAAMKNSQTFLEKAFIHNVLRFVQQSWKSWTRFFGRMGQLRAKL
jgi:hypothetical protein